MFKRALVGEIAARMQEPREFMQVLVGPRQTGKTTVLGQVVDSLDMPYRFISADDYALNTEEWLASEWRGARMLASGATQHHAKEALLIVDEIQKVSHWAAVAKKMWDEDTRFGLALKVLLTGSSSLLLQRGMEDSLMGRFEVLYSTHWSFSECKEAFGYSLEDFLFFGGYPGAAKRRADPSRWARYMRTSIVEPTISQDILQMERVEKPALLKALFALGSAYSAQEISYTKIMGQLQDAGNAVTIAHYLDLLSKAGMVSGLQKYAQDAARVRRSSPRLMVHDTSLMTYPYGPDIGAVLSDPEKRGHVVESAVGAYLIARSAEEGFRVFWWRTPKGAEVDFVIQKADMLTAIEVKSGRVKGAAGIREFLKRNPHASALIVGDAACPLEGFLTGDTPLFAAR